MRKMWIIFIETTSDKTDDKLQDDMPDGNGKWRVYERVSKEKEHYFLCKEIWDRCTQCNGPGAVCVSSDRYDHQYDWRTDRN